MKNKIINVFVFIISLVLFISYLFIVAKHIDFFATKTLAYASIIELKEKESGDGTVITIQFQNQFKEKREEETLNLSNSFSKDFGKWIPIKGSQKKLKIGINVNQTSQGGRMV